MIAQVPNLVDPSALQQEEFHLYDGFAERNVLACLINSPQLILGADRLIKEQWFFNPMNRYAYQILKFIAERASKNGWRFSFTLADALMVAREVGRGAEDKFLRKTEGGEKWNQLTEQSTNVSVDGFESYCAALRDRALRVAMYKKARQLQLSVMDFSRNPDAREVAGKYEAIISNMAHGGSDARDGRLARLGDYGDEFMFLAKLNRVHPEAHIFHLCHPRFPARMRLMGGGYRRNSLSIVCARPKVGKTTLLLEEASDFSMLDKLVDPATGVPFVCRDERTGECRKYEPIPVLFLDTEMSGSELFSRELSNLSRIDEDLLMKGAFYDREDLYEHCVSKAKSLSKAPFYYVSVAGRPIDCVISMIRQFVNQYVGYKTLALDGRAITIANPCAVYYDWLKIPSTGDLANGIKEYQALGDIATKLKDTAKMLNIPIICGAQQSRSNIGKGEREQVENLEATVANSDKLIQFCNTLFILRNPSMEMEEAIEGRWGAVHKDQNGNLIEGKNGWRFNQLLSIVVQRQGKECRTGIPMRLVRGQAHYEEVADDEAMKFVKDYYKTKKANRRAGSEQQGGVQENRVTKTASTVNAAYSGMPAK